MKTVFSSHSEVCHEFAHVWDDSRHGRGSNIFFEDLTLYSYGKHFILAKKVWDGKNWFTFLNTNNYSVSTSKHKNHINNAVYRDGTILEIPFLTNSAFYLHQLKEIAQKMIEQAKTHFKAQLRARSNTYEFTLGMRLLNEVNLLNRHFPEIVKQVLHHEVENFNEASERVEYLTKNREKIREQKERKEVEKNKELLTKWLNGSYSGQLYKLPIYLRLSKDKEQIETSHGAKVPLFEAIRLFKDIQSNKEVINRHIGSFRVNEITLDYIQIGCHRIRFENVNSFMEGLC